MHLEIFYEILRRLVLSLTSKSVLAANFLSASFLIYYTLLLKGLRSLRFVFYKEINHFNQQGHIKSDS